MSLDESFDAAQARVKGLSTRPNNDQLLALYALFKQATLGDVSGKRPGMFDLKGRAKYDAWAKKGGTSSDDAKREYVDRVASICA